MELLLTDVSKTNPTLLKKLADDPQLKRQQIESLKQLLAYATQAQKDGLADDPVNKQELENIRAEILALNYDREVNKGKLGLPPLGSIPTTEVEQWLAGAQRESEFEKFLETKMAILKESDPTMLDRKITDEERAQARDIFARTRIYLAAYESELKKGTFAKEFVERANLQVKLQQAQFLARLYSERVADKNEVTDTEIASYIAAHPELDTAPKRAFAQKILDRAKAGEDFAKLANEFSQDPGNKGLDGKLNGGLYQNVPKGRMISVFENAALALKPGEISPELVETDYGFHIIKLDRKFEAVKDKAGRAQGAETYDVRHMLISTGVKNSEDPNAREVPVKDYVREILEKHRLDELVVRNHVQVAEDFTVPALSQTPSNVQTPVKKHLAKKRPAHKR
jgi:parvulin-like peptidyl-prolyl isomerase